MLPYPLKAPGQSAGSVPWLSVGVASIALVLFAGQWWYLYLPSMVQDALSWLSAGRLYVDPGQRFFSRYKFGPRCSSIRIGGNVSRC